MRNHTTIANALSDPSIGQNPVVMDPDGIGHPDNHRSKPIDCRITVNTGRVMQGDTKICNIARLKGKGKGTAIQTDSSIRRHMMVNGERSPTAVRQDQEGMAFGQRQMPRSNRCTMNRMNRQMKRLM